MDYKLQDLIDIEQFQALQDRLNEIYSFPSAIIDNEGNILTATAWQDVCTKFHRMNKECEKECIKSDQYILSHLHEVNPAVSYRCPHGLVDNATPIVIDGIHYGNFFTGQFFLDDPDVDFFKEQAKKYGFDEHAYLDAVTKVPVWSEEQLNSYLFFIKGLIEVISSSGLKKLKEIEARRKIEESEERASAIISQMQDGFWITSGKNGQVVDVNPAMCEMLGYSRDELLNMSVADVEAIDSPEEIEQRIEQIVRDGSANFQSRHRRKDDMLIDVEVSVIHLSSSNQFFAIHRDVTKRKQAEKQLSESEQRFRSIFEQAPIGMGLIESHTNKFLQVNPKYCEIVGRTKDEMLNMDFHMITHPDDIDIDLENKQKLIDGEIRSYELDKRYIKSDQSVVWAHLTIVAMWKEDDEPRHHLTMVEDITERKRVQEELLKSEERFRSLYENATVGMYRTTPDGEILLANPTLVNMLGYASFEELALRNLEHEGYDPDYKRSNFRQKIETEEIVIGLEAAWNRKDGSTIYVRESAKAIRDRNGNITHYEGTVENITERKKAERRIQEHLNRLAALRKIDQAISSSFDLNISLNILLSYAFRLLDVDAATVLKLNPELNVLEYITDLGFKTDVVKKSSVRLGESYAGKVALDRQVIQVQNIADEPDNLFTNGFLKNEDFVSYYGAPLIVKGKVIGVLEVFSRSIIERDSEWLDFFNALAGQAGIAIDNLTLFNDLQNSNLELLMAYDATIEGWSRAMDLRDEETEGHTRRVTDLTLKLAERMRIDRSEWVHIRRGALLHDIGKLGVPDQILRKPGKLTDEEWKTMRKHPIHAMEMLKPISYLRPAIDIPYCHHEWWNGSGYPRGLRGEQIPLAARLFAIVDVWDALRSDRPYRPAWTEEKTLEYIKSQSGTHFDPEIVAVFFELIGED